VAQGEGPEFKPQYYKNKKETTYKPEHLSEKFRMKLGIVVHTYNPSTWRDETGGT
jgi:hypothetical protein